MHISKRSAREYYALICILNSTKMLVIKLKYFTHRLLKDVTVNMPSSTKQARLMARRRRGVVVKSERTATSQDVARWQIGIQSLGILVSVCVAVCFNFSQISNFLSTNSGNSMGVRRLSIDGSSVIVLDNFIPLELAVRWRNIFQSEWDRDPSGFLLATNNDGGVQSRGGNAKYRSNERNTARRRIAEKMHRNGMFSYAKHELSPDHEVLKEIADLMLLNETRHRIAIALNTTVDRLDANELSDLFATNFGEGDFYQCILMGTLVRTLLLPA